MPRHSKKVTRHRRKLLQRRTMRGGYYSFNGGVATGAPKWTTGSEMGSFVTDRVGNNAVYGGRRKRGGGESQAASAAKTAIMGGRRRRHKKRGGGSSSSSSSSGSDTEGGRRRRSKKTKGRRTMRGGSKYGGVAASFVGTGQRGMGDYVSTNTKYPPFGGAAQGAFNNAGAQPGSGFGSFVRVGP